MGRARLQQALDHGPRSEVATPRSATSPGVTSAVVRIGLVRRRAPRPEVQSPSC